MYVTCYVIICMYVCMYIHCIQHTYMKEYATIVNFRSCDLDYLVNAWIFQRVLKFNLTYRARAATDTLSHTWIHPCFASLRNIENF